MDPVVAVRTPDELLAAVPHMLGFNPEESIVVVPVTRGLPLARVDLPRTAADWDEVTRNLRGPYGRYACPGAMSADPLTTKRRCLAGVLTSKVVWFGRAGAPSSGATACVIPIAVGSLWICERAASDGLASPPRSWVFDRRCS